MFLFQTAVKAADTQKPHEIVATYMTTAGGKEKIYNRAILERADGKVFDSKMNANPANESAWTTKERWKQRLGLDLNNFEFSFAGRKDEKPAKQPEQNAFMETKKPDAGKSTLKQIPKKMKQSPRTYEQHLDVLESRPVFKETANFRGDWETFIRKASEKTYGGKSIIDIAYEKGKKYNVDPKLIIAYVFVESRGVPDKPSKEYEYVTDASGQKQKQEKPDEEQSWGLMQLIPTKQGITIKEAITPVINVDRGTKYIAANLKAYPGRAPIQVLGDNRGTAGAGSFEGNGYMAKTEKSTNDANQYSASVLQIYNLLSESKFDIHKGERASTFLKTADYEAAMKALEQDRQGGYLKGFDFSQKFDYPQK